VLVNNKDKIKNLNIDFNKYIDTNSIPEWLKDSLKKGLEPLKEILNINLDFDTFKNLEEKARWKVNEFLDNNVWWLIDSIKNK
jgi:ABC-type Fe3+ transport system substrate-binding protein